MKLESYSSHPSLLFQGQRVPQDNLRLLAAAMNLSNHMMVSVPEQGLILRLLERDRTGGLSTRQLAELCEVSIYRVRHLLLPLEKEGRIARDKMQKHHRWFLSEESVEIANDSNKAVFCLQQ